MDTANSSSIRFIGEQNGQAACALKQQLIRLFEGLEEIKLAYLADADYEDGSSNVLLCLSSSLGEDSRLVPHIGRIFRAMFGTDQHLDVLFINENEAGQVAKVCQPFYVSRRIS